MPDPDGALFRWIVDHARLGVTVAVPIEDGAGRVVDLRYAYVNPRGAAILGRPADEVVGRSMSEVGVGGTDELVGLLVDLYARDEPYTQVVEVDDGPAAGWYDLLVGRAGEWLVVAFDDLTAQVETRERERLAHERMVAAFRRVPGAVYSLDRDLRITYIDPDAERMFGRTADEVVGRRLDELYPEFAVEHVPVLRDAIELGEPVEFDVYVRAPSPGWYSVRGFPDAEGLTAYINPLEPLLRLEQRAAQIERLESMATLTGGIAHDFNNLMMVIGGHASLLGDAIAHDHDAAEDVAAIVDAARRAADLTTQLLSVGRQQVVQPTTVDLGAVVTARGDAWRAAAPSGATVEVVVPDEPVLALVDRSELERVLDHLVRNACEAITDTGRVVVEVERNPGDVPTPDASVGGVAGGCFGVVTVGDDGIGMDAETLARAPEPFFTTKSRAGSSGLGLSVAHGAARQAGGRLVMYSEPGVGTTARLSLPEASSSSPSAASSPSPADLAGREVAAPGPGETVLVVDDNASVRALTARILEDLGYAVATAADGARALEWLAQDGHRVDLVVADVVMPGLSGYDLAEAVRERLPALPVLFISGYAEPRVALAGGSIDGDHFLSKPFTSADLARRVRRLIDAGR